MRKIILGCDVDDVVADLCGSWCRAYNLAYDDTMTPNDWSTWDLTTIVKPECGAKIYDFLKDPSLYEQVLPVPGAFEGIAQIRSMGHDVVFITSCGYTPEVLSASAGAKLLWLQRWGFLPNDRTAVESYVVAANKTRVKADLLVDDRASTIEQWQSRGIIFERPHNRNWHHSAGYRARTWGDVVELVGKFTASHEFRRSVPTFHSCTSASSEGCEACRLGKL